MFHPGSHALLNRGHSCNEQGIPGVWIWRPTSNLHINTNLARIWAGIEYDLDEGIIALSQIVMRIGGRWLCTFSRRNHVWTVKLKVTYYFATSMASRNRISSWSWRTNWFSFQILEFRSFFQSPWLLIHNIFVVKMSSSITHFKCTRNFYVFLNKLMRNIMLIEEGNL